MAVLHRSKQGSIIKSKSVFNALSVLEKKGSEYIENFHINHIMEILDMDGNVTAQNTRHITVDSAKAILSREAKFSDSALTNCRNGWYKIEKEICSCR